MGLARRKGLPDSAADQLFYSVPNGHFQRISTSRAKRYVLGHRHSRIVMWGDLWRYPKRIIRPEARQYIDEKTRQDLDRVAKKVYLTGMGRSERDLKPGEDLDSLKPFIPNTNRPPTERKVIGYKKMRARLKACRTKARKS